MAPMAKEKSLPLSARLAASFLFVAPLAFSMGMPLPIALGTLQNRHSQFVPWAWGINGCASVISAILAVFLALEIGFSGVMLSAIALYFVAWLNRVEEEV